MSTPDLPGVPGAAPTEPVCPRHPGRVAYVRCQRCERPVCPECQRPAAVGVQCVDCVREGNRGLRTPRTPFGGRVSQGRPVVTLTLIGVCVALYLGQLADDAVTNRFLFVPVLALSEPWRFLTSAFLHSPSWPLHIAFNMYALWLVGPPLEYLLGRTRFLALYLLSALGGSVFLLLLASPTADSWFTPAVGASGAVFGLFAALVVLQRRLGRDITPLVGVILVNAVLGFVIPNVAWQAHLGGLVTGAAVAAVFATAPAQRRTAWQAAGFAVVVVALATILVIKVAGVGTTAFA